MQKIVRIAFRYEVPYARFEPHMPDFIASCADAPGMVWKIWAYDDARGVGSGIYLFEDEGHASAYLARMVPFMQTLVADVSGEMLDIHLGATRATRGPVRQAA